jgi:hypothetical protein
VRVTKEQQSSQNAAGTQAAGVAANLPKANGAGSEQKQSNDQTQKREELTNYEVSSKSIQTTSASFVIRNLSIAVLINRVALTASLGDKASPEAAAAQVKEIEQLVASAAGLDKQRGDVVKIAVVDFVDSSRDLEPAPGPLLVEIVARQFGSIVNAAAIVLVAAMTVWFGLRPRLKMLLATPAPGVSTALVTSPRGGPSPGRACRNGPRGRRRSWTLAVARYNAGPGNPAAEQTYVCAVIRNMVASGFGQWTAYAGALPLKQAESEGRLAAPPPHGGAVRGRGDVSPPKARGTGALR